TFSTVLMCILTVIVRHNIQGRPRAEIDVVVGRDALPSLKHRPSLPYVETILREAIK
ncbi:hypothetical protein BV22DRAFT_988028, partial [Leucogyrophana mollusca]